MDNKLKCHKFSSISLSMVMQNQGKWELLPTRLVDIHIFFSGIDSSDDDSSSEGDEMPWQQIWLSSDSDLDYDALRKENNWSVCFCW